jgi:hypothetical protein
MPVGWDCPLHDDPSPLVLAGADGQLIGQTVTFTVSGLILCRGCGAQWPATQWLMLGRILEEAS